MRDRIPINAGGGPGAAPAPPGGAPYDDGRGGLCGGNDNTCLAHRVKGEDFCIGHLRSEAKKAAAE